MTDVAPPDLKKIRDLDAVETRVLGALLEKEQATPDYYPLTVNSLIAACNQKSNREPVTALTETEIVEALDRLRADVMAWRTDGARAEKWSQSISRRLDLDPAEKAILTLLMLRGPQTPGELRSRSGRLHEFADLREVEEALGRLAHPDRALAVELPRAPGQKENRWAHLLSGEVEIELPEAPTVVRRTVGSGDADPTPRLLRLEERVTELADRLAALERELGS